MTFAYFDTSALVRRYLKERGSQQVGALLRRREVLSSAITPVEVFSALSRRKRSGELSEEDVAALLSRIQSDRLRWELVEIGEAVLRRAEEIVQGTVPVRALDAVHIASLMAFEAASSMHILFVTGDARQRDGAKHLGLDVIWVG